MYNSFIENVISRNLTRLNLPDYVTVTNYMEIFACMTKGELYDLVIKMQCFPPDYKKVSRNDLYDLLLRVIIQEAI